VGSRLDPELDPGSFAGDYRVDVPIGSGAFGTVYRGEHPVIGKAVAIKVLNQRCSVDPTMVARFVAEARVVNTIGHRGIVDIFAFGQLPDGRHFHVMELLQGDTLQDLLARRGHLPLAEVLNVLEPVARALDAAHAAGIAHRDLKPANIFLANDSDGFRPLLLDFGVAKLLFDEAEGHHTETGATVGTPAYMAPEQCLGGTVGPRSDVYALGVVAFELLTGRLPFEATSRFGWMAAQLNDTPPLVHTLRPELPASVSTALAAMLAKAPEDRPHGTGEALAALRAASGDAALAPAAGSSVRPWMIGLAVAAALALGIVGWRMVPSSLTPGIDDGASTTAAVTSTAGLVPSPAADVGASDSAVPGVAAADAGLPGVADAGLPDANPLDAAPLAAAPTQPRLGTRVGRRPRGTGGHGSAPHAPASRGPTPVKNPASATGDSAPGPHELDPW
jgi:serine/threonine-protein kinase